MGCFLACFGKDKDRKQRKRCRKSPPIERERYKPLQTARSASPKKPIIEVADDSIPELRETQEQESDGGCRKKVTFDLNVKTYEGSVIHEERQHRQLEEEGKDTVKEENNEEESEGKANASKGAYPVNHRYQNCGGSDDEDDIDDREDDEDEDEGSDEEDDNAVILATEEESYDSFFSLSMETEKQSNCQEASSPIPIDVPAKGNPQDRSQYVHLVPNPLQNLSEWKEVKVQALAEKNPNKEKDGSERGNKMLNFKPEPLQNSDKENIKSEPEPRMIVFRPEPVLKVNKPEQVFDRYQKPSFSTKEEISVDASLSTWLVSSENSTKEKRPQGSSNSPMSNSSVNREERPILGALTVDDIKQSSVTSSPRRSPTRSPDDIPILGTVGSYWNSEARSEIKGIPNTTSKYKEDKRVNWHSTPFEVRLERALNKGASEACPR